MKNQQENDVSNYYDNNTRYFLKFGQHQGAAHIHQLLWAPDVQNQLEAVQYSVALVWQQIQAIQARHILDLGCGVGSSLAFLRQQFLAQSAQNIQLQGITISQQQVAIAQSRYPFREIPIHVRHGSFQQLPDTIGPIDLSYAIEAFVHSPDAARFFQEVTLASRTGARLILIDDFLSENASPSTKREQYIRRFKEGWHLGSLLTTQQVNLLASQAGFRQIHQQNLSKWLPKHRLRDYALHALLPLMPQFLRKHKYPLALIGGDARWYALRNNWIQYQLLVFEKID